MIDGSQEVRPLAALRYAAALLAFAAITLFIVWKASDALLLIFAGILFAAFLDALTRLLGEVVPWQRGVRLAVVCALLVILLAAIGWSSSGIALQAGELTATLREQLNYVLGWLQQRGIEMPGTAGAAVGEEAGADVRGDDTPTFRSLLPDLQGLFGTAWAAAAVVLGLVGNAAAIIFFGIFFAAQPIVYRDALLVLLPPTRRARVAVVLDETGKMLRQWLMGQSISMLVIFLFTWLGLMMVGVRPAFALGLQAGLLAFVPTLGALLSGFVIVLASLSHGLPGILGAMVVYLGVQTLDTYLLTPMIQKRAINVPPGLLFANQIVLGLLFGFAGIALATPLSSIARVFILRFYVEDMLGDVPKEVR